MSFDMTEKLIHSIGLDDDNTEMMLEMDIKNESKEELKQEIEEEINERKKDDEGINNNNNRLEKDEMKTVLEIESDKKITDKDMNILESSRTHEHQSG